MTGFDLAQARYDGATPTEPFECDECEDGPGCTCEEDAREAWEDAQIERADARRKGDEFA